MAKGLKGEFKYDSKADVLYFTLNTGEPSYCEETNDIILVERGIFSKQVTGFRFLDVKHHGIKRIFISLKKNLSKVLQRDKQEIPAALKAREQILRNAFSELPEEVGSLDRWDGGHSS